MRVLVLNLQNRITTQSTAALAYLRQMSPSLMVLSDVAWTKRLEDFCSELGDYSIEAANRDGKSTVMVASKWPLQVVEARRCFLEVSVPDIAVQVVAAYLPSPSSRDKNRKSWRKEFWDLLCDRAAALQEKPALIAGDLNSFCPEDSHNRTATKDDRLRELRERGWRDAWLDFRDEADEDCYTWYSRNGRSGGFRLDYVFVSPAFVRRTPAMRARHDSSTRSIQISDHSAVVLDLPS